jgi:hypothetical protein
MHFLNSFLSGVRVHPLGSIELLGELGLDVRNDGVTKLLCFSRESFLNEETAENPTEAIVDMANACTPALRGGVGILYVSKTALRAKTTRVSTGPTP